MSLVKTSTTRLAQIVRSIQKLYPISYADSAWDNTGLLVDASVDSDVVDVKSPIRVLLTVDLTQSVVEEAVQSKTNLVLAYHPFIFKGLKSISPQDPQQKSLIRLLQTGISVYCPHTAVDAAVDGVNDWLVDGIAQGNVATKKPIEVEPESPEGVGMGRLVELIKPIKLTEAIENVKKSLQLDYIQIATNDRSKPIKSIAVCAGSGGGVFKGIDADLYYTGELSHHEALYFKELGKAVIACNHSNTERGFLKQLKLQLEHQFAADGNTVLLNISTTDHDPYEVI